MSTKTEKFNVTVKCGNKTYAPGKPVPLGGKYGLSDEEVSSLRANFGDWTGGPESGAQSQSTEVANLQATLDTIRDERDMLLDRASEAEQDLHKVTKERDQLLDDNKVLADRVATLEAAAKGGDGK
ncbi:hypothetical protein SAMN05892877_1272 [Rhizobium subbaraonis]|uniref:Uncharacterized protein n=1 Tax=Rhizobium subbaraonis TaxID=908946 RepID=A0A285V252_9HYPH|nr:hypothetical protein [Rhizobium subbaraonis]SOC47086.1 hypothetical protein SAMN05892877_1272 [Rhizobium subbaraonis]